MASTTSQSPEEAVPDAPVLGPLTEMAKQYRAGLEDKEGKKPAATEDRPSPHADRVAETGGLDRAGIEEALAGGIARYDASEADDKSASKYEPKAEEPKASLEPKLPAEPKAPVKK